MKVPILKSFCFISFDIVYVEFTSRHLILFVALLSGVFSSIISFNRFLSLYMKAVLKFHLLLTY